MSKQTATRQALFVGPVPTARQLTFARAYFFTGSAAQAARTAGYTGRFAAQAGHKLLKRAGTRAALAELVELARVNLRRHVLRGLNRVRRQMGAPDASLATLDHYAGLIAALMRLAGLGDDDACRMLVDWTQQESPRLRWPGLLAREERGALRGGIG